MHTKSIRNAAVCGTIIGAGALIQGAADAGNTWTMMNPTGRDYRDELVRIKVDVPAGMSRKTHIVKEDGTAVPWQIEEIGGKLFVWVRTDLGKDQTHAYEVTKGKAQPARDGAVGVSEANGCWTLDNGLMAVRVPSKAAGSIEEIGPVRQVRLPDGKWVGKSFWKTDRELKRFTSELIGDGTVFAKVRVRYEFEGAGGLFAETPAFYQADIMLGPGRNHAIIEESYAMGRGEYWEFDAAAGWDARAAMVKPHFGGFGRPTLNAPDGNPYPFPPQSLHVGQTRMGDTLLNLIPRWSQAYDDGWFFAVTDGAHAVGGIPVRAGKWLWPHDSMIEIKVKPGADYAGMRCPTWRGKRYWYLTVGPQKDWGGDQQRNEYVLRHAVDDLDKLHHEYILDWPGLQPPDGVAMTPEERAAYGSGAGRFSRRTKAFAGWGPGGASWTGGDHPITRLTRLLGRFDPDCYGTHWLYFSPENPNFFSHWVHGMVGGAETFQEHPRFDAIKRLVEQKCLEELYFGVTLPGGAGQECFGYMARPSWGRHEKSAERIGIDTSWWPWRKAAGAFIYAMSFPMADGTRRSHPGGDTHPPGPDPIAAARDVGAPLDVAKRRTEEFPGFGVLFRHRPDTPHETYFAFKSGPNRGHFHGDQLAFHYCANGHPLIVDHHCTYGPRAGQEHMHNRVAFHTDDMPWANMDGYERVIAFETSKEVDIAIGQVESERLREKLPFPAERWDWSYPRIALDPNLKYRRSVVLLKDVPVSWESPSASGRTAAAAERSIRDLVVIRDQSIGPELLATYCLHVYGERCERKGNVFDFDGVQVFVAKPAEYEVSRHDWQHTTGGPEATKGLRLTTRGKTSEFVTVLLPKPRKMFPVTHLTLNKALERKNRSRRTREVTTSRHDLNLILTWRDGKIVPQAHVTAMDYHRKMWFVGSVTARDEKGLSLRILGQGLAKRQKKPMEWEFDLTLERNGDALVGTFKGAVNGTPATGKVTGVHKERGSAPVPAYEEPSLAGVAALENGVRLGDIAVTFSGDIDDREDAAYVRVTRGDDVLAEVTGSEIDMDRSQGDIGIFVPDAGYPFGVLPDWLLRQRTRVPKWYEPSWPPTVRR